MTDEIELGDKVEDKVTGFKGIVTAEIKYIYDCKQFRVTPVCNDEGAQQKSDWIDEPQLKLLKKRAVKIEKKAEPPKHGGERDHP